MFVVVQLLKFRHDLFHVRLQGRGLVIRNKILAIIFGGVPGFCPITSKADVAERCTPADAYFARGVGLGFVGVASFLSFLFIPKTTAQGNDRFPAAILPHLISTRDIRLFTRVGTRCKAQNFD